MALIILALLSIPTKKLYGEDLQTNTIQQQDTTVTPGYHDNYVVAMWVDTPPPVVVAPPKPKLPYDICSCVSYARWLSGINVGPIGLAKYHPVNSQIPAVGGLVVFGGTTGHLAVVVGIDGANITIKESNWTHCHLGTRVIPITTASILGYYNP